MTEPWHRAIAYALVGEDLELGLQARPDVPALLRELASRGWTGGRIADLARGAAAAGWPFVVPDALRRGLGAAQLHAAIGSARTELGLDVLAVLPPSRRTTLTADERRLRADVPPHW
ncbi:hypothetical protein [Propioniciclava soli]|uniref:Uncharacterized protein n=1 Tax=Propioniciclava soli TaxID=2775081 RepID=A0ABZ3C8S3_9ACTN|nr:hypothetical protein [Propioniciclava soli]